MNIEQARKQLKIKDKVWDLFLKLDKAQQKEVIRSYIKINLFY